MCTEWPFCLVWPAARRRSGPARPMARICRPWRAIRRAVTGTYPVISYYRPEKPLPYCGYMSAWSNLPSALPPHGTVLAWARGCRCDECEPEYERLVSELARRGPLQLPAVPDPPKLDADTRARL